MFTKLCSKIAAGSGDTDESRYPKEHGYIYGVGVFSEVMRREYARSDRNGHGFAFAVLHLPQGEENQSAYSGIIDLVGDRLRVTDHAGWLKQDSSLGILLYACTIDDALCFVERVCEDCGFKGLKYNIYSYPDDFPEDILKL